MNFVLPKNLTNTVERAWGELGREWLRKFPVTLRAVAEKWKLGDITPFDEPNYNFVARATADGLPVVLKLGVPCEEFRNEIAALVAFDGRGAVKLLDFDQQLGAMLLEDLGVGKPWTLEKDDEYTEAIAQTMLLLWKVDSTLTPPRVRVEVEFPTTLQWAEVFERVRGKHPDSSFTKLAETAASKWEELENSTERRLLLHGDLHHGNVLLTTTGPHAIDPKGVIGDPAFECYALLRNPTSVSQKQLSLLADKRIEIVAKITGLDKQRIRDWGFCGAVLSMCWDIEEGVAPGGMEFAESLL